MENLLKSICAAGLDKGVFSGCSAGVVFRNREEFVHTVVSCGKTKAGDGGKDITNDTFFDLASLTKPLCTVPCVLKLMEKGDADWNSSPSTLLNNQKGKNKSDYTLKHLLAHCSGLPAYKPYFKGFQAVVSKANRKLLLEKVWKEDPVYPAGSRNLYSDLDYILLGDLVEQLSGQDLDCFYEREITSKLGLSTRLCFFPLWKKSPVSIEYIAATQDCPWRGRVLQGEVDDEHSWLMGGVAGHAGLFGTIEGVLGLCKVMFDTWKGRGDGKVLSRDLFPRLFQRTGKDNTWYMGFDTPTPGKSSSGRYFSAQSAGHLGFSGTSFWMDPEKDILIVLLTNRIHPTRDNLKIREFRPWFHDRIMEKLIRNKVTTHGLSDLV